MTFRNYFIVFLRRSSITLQSNSKPAYQIPDISFSTAAQISSRVVPQSYNESPPLHQRSV